MIGPGAELVQWAQVLAPVIAALAAVASWRSASASRATAGRADQTARRAAEALGRVTRPQLAALLHATDERSRQPHPMQLYVRNDAPHGGYLRAARMHGPDGALLAEVSNLSLAIGVGMAADSVHYVPLGKVARVRPDVAPGEEGTSPSITWTVEYTDVAGLPLLAPAGAERRDGPIRAGQHWPRPGLPVLGELPDGASGRRDRAWPTTSSEAMGAMTWCGALQPV